MKCLLLQWKSLNVGSRLSLPPRSCGACERRRKPFVQGTIRLRKRRIHTQYPVRGFRIMGGRITFWRVRERSEEHTTELQSLMRISYAVLCLNKKKIPNNHHV